MARNPAWVEDELLVVLDLYLDHRRVLEENDPRVIAASDLLNRLPLHSQAGTPGFRTPDAVVLRMANYRSYDPTTTAKGMSDAGHCAEQVWLRYADQPAAVRDLVAAIETIANASGGVQAAPTPEPDEADVLEGRLLYRLHRRRERNPGIRARKLKQVAATGSTASCEVCGLVPDRIYGAGSDGIFECHHLWPLKLGERTTRLADIALLCATCHRAIHAKGLLVRIEDLREALPLEFRAAMHAISRS